jgi:membrane-associated protease RseP (regulator of RpoE activity)
MQTAKASTNRNKRLFCRESRQTRPMESSYTLQTKPPDPLVQVSNALAAELAGLFRVTSISPNAKNQTISFGGRLLRDPERSYDEIRRRFRPHGYTPLLRRKKGQDIVLALEGLHERGKTGNPLINVLLLVATVATTLAAGAQLAGYSLLRAFFAASPLAIAQALLAGAPFAITLLGILGIHELGHYVAAQVHGVRATLPYFIPMPFGLGTLGAFIAIKSPMKDRKVLFDIGLAGPYAGLVATIPLLLLGLWLSLSDFVLVNRSGLLSSFGASVFIDAVARLFADVPAGQTIVPNSIFFAAWLGLLLTGINLIPAGQLDGGHAAYALLGRSAHAVAFITFFLLIAAGVLLGSYIWFVWAFFVMLGGLRHPPPLNDITDVGLIRKLIGLLTIALFFLIVGLFAFMSASAPLR